MPDDLGDSPTSEVGESEPQTEDEVQGDHPTPTRLLDCETDTQAANYLKSATYSQIWFEFVQLRKDRDRQLAYSW